MPADLDDQRNSMLGTFLAKNNSIFPQTPLSKLEMGRQISEGVISSGELSISPEGNNNRWPTEDPKSASKRERTFEEFRSRAAEKVAPVPIVPNPVKVPLPLIPEKAANPRYRENPSISNLKLFLLHFFRNEKISPIPRLAPHELELLSGVLTRKYGKPIKFR